MGMKIKIIKLVCMIFVDLMLLALIVYSEIKQIPAISSISGIACGLITPKAYHFFQDCFDNTKWKSDLRKYLRGRVLKKNDRVRISFAYLFRIKIDNQYFLIKNKRGTRKFQPVGGAYKFNKIEKEYLNIKFKIVDDNCIPIDKNSRNDYRLQVPVKHLKNFVIRFDKTENRENQSDLSREYKEELVESGLLQFTHMQYRYCGRHLSNLEFSRHFGLYELLLADIFEIELSDKQESLLRQLLSKESEEYSFAPPELISSCGIKAGSDNLLETIADHSKKILQENESELVDSPGRNKTFSASWGI